MGTDYGGKRPEEQAGQASTLRAAHPSNQALIDVLATLEPIDEELGPIDDPLPEPIDPFADWEEPDDCKDEERNLDVPAYEASRDNLDIRVGGLDDPQVQALLAVHVAFGRADRPAENAHVLPADALAAPEITFWSAWAGDALAGFVALKELASDHGELKSMRTDAAFLRRGVARLLLAEVIATARARGYRRLSLGTGSTPPFDPANRLYEAAGFTDCAAFGGYPDSPLNRFMTMTL